MTNDLRDQLRKLRNGALQDVGQRLLEGAPAETIDPELRRIDALGKVIDSFGPVRVEWKWSALIGGAALVCVLVIAALPIPMSTSVTSSVRTEALQVTLEQDWRCDILPAERVHIANVGSFRSSPLGLDVTASASDASLEAVGSELSLQDLQVSRGTTMELMATENGLTIFFRGARPALPHPAPASVFSPIFFVSGRLALQGDVRMEYGRWGTALTVFRRSFNAKAPGESVEFRATGAVYVPVELNLRGQHHWAVRDVTTTALSFLRPVAGRVGDFESAVRSADMAMNEVVRKETLADGDEISLDRIEQRRLEIVYENGILTVRFEGLVGSVKAGPHGFQRELKPSMLEYVYHKQPLLSLGASVFGLIWGGLWTVKQLLRG